MYLSNKQSITDMHQYWIPFTIEAPYSIILNGLEVFKDPLKVFDICQDTEVCCSSIYISLSYFIVSKSGWIIPLLGNDFFTYAIKAGKAVSSTQNFIAPIKYLGGGTSLFHSRILFSFQRLFSPIGQFL